MSSNGSNDELSSWEEISYELDGSVEVRFCIAFKYSAIR